MRPAYSEAVDREPSLARNATANLAGFVIFLAVGFFMSPFIIRHLGDARYGAWTLVAEMVGYYALLDLGLRNALRFYVAHYSGRGAHHRLHSVVCAAFWTLAAVGGALALAGIGGALAFPHLFAKGQMDAAEAVSTMAIMSVVIGMSLPMETFSSVLTGCRRMDLNTMVEIACTLLVAAGTYAALEGGGGLIAMSLIFSAGRVLTWILSYLLTRRVLGPFSLHPGGFRRSELRPLAGYGSMTLTIHLANLLSYRVDLIVVGAFLGVKWVAYYQVGRMVVAQITSINFHLGRAFTPHLTHLYARGEMAELKRLFLLGARLTGLLSMPLAACVLTFGTPFLALWIDPAYVSGPPLFRSDGVMVVLLLANAARWPQNMSLQLIYATGKLGFLAYVNVISAIVNLGLSLLLVRHYGLVGVALGTLIPSVIANGIAIPAYVTGRFRFGLLEYVREALLRPLIVGAPVLAFAQTLLILHYPSTWSALLQEGAATCALAAVLCWALGLRPEEKRLVAARVSAAAALRRAC